jgi:hypothetical protein
MFALGYPKANHSDLCSRDRGSKDWFYLIREQIIQLILELSQNKS